MVLSCSDLWLKQEVVFWGGYAGGWSHSKTRHTAIYLLFGEGNKGNNEYFDLKKL